MNDSNMSTTLDPSTVDCMGLTAQDIENLWFPWNYHYFIAWTWPETGSGRTDCTVGANAMGAYMRLQSPADSVDLEDMLKSQWDGAFDYAFPASFGWGGALWIDQSSVTPSSPSADAFVQAMLCDTAGRCMMLLMYPPAFAFLRPNANGVMDPIGTSVTMIETAWRRLHAERPDLLPTALPKVNRSPYVPLKVPPFPGATPGAEPPYVTAAPTSMPT